MNFDWFTTATQKELEHFKDVCNQLLSRTYIVRTLYKPGEGRVNNPDYVFLSAHDEVIREFFQADMFIFPSYTEGFPNVIMEAMACGTPCVGFNTGGIPEMIDHLHNGYVATYKSAEDFANGIYWTLTDPDYPNLSEQACRKAVAHYSACRKAVAHYSEDTVARRFIELYNKL